MTRSATPLPTTDQKLGNILRILGDGLASGDISTEQFLDCLRDMQVRAAEGHTDPNSLAYALMTAAERAELSVANEMRNAYDTPVRRVS